MVLAAKRRIFWRSSASSRAANVPCAAAA